MQVFENRPTDCSDREDREIRCYDLLDSLSVGYTRVDHAPAETMKVCEDIDKALDAVISKNLFLSNRQQTQFYLLVVDGDKPFKTKDISKQLGVARLSFAPESFMEQFLDLHPGSVSILGLMNDHENRVQLLIDRELNNREFFSCHPCKNTSTIRFTIEDLFNKVIPAMGHVPVMVEV